MGIGRSRDGIIRQLKNAMKEENLDLTADPKEDFYRYACGGWMESHPLPAEYASFGTFNELAETAREQVKDLIMNLHTHPEASVKDTIAQKVSDLYSLAMDATRLNKEGAAPILPLIDNIEASDTGDMEKLLAWQHMGIGGSFFSSGVTIDPDNSDMHLLAIGETGLGLGDRDLYLEDTDHALRIREAYKTFVKRIMELVGYGEDTQQRVWETVIKIETEIARHLMPREERRDPQKRHNIFSMDEFTSRFPGFDWKKYFGLLDVATAEKINVANPAFLDFIVGYVSTLSEREIKDFMVYEIISEASGVLSDEFYDASFEMFGRVMSGTESQHPRWKRATSLVGSMLGMAIGKLYVEQYFPEEHKDYMINMVEHLRQGLRKHIEDLAWMSDSTKRKALEKLEAMKVKIGYPDKWKDYSEIHINPEESLHDNLLAASKWVVKDNYSKLHEPVDKEKWHMNPQTVNAYYSPVNNEICFPAGILQPPFYDAKASDAENYGAIGVVIGHEMTHGFDDSGRKFDKDGNLAEWWAEEDAARFNEIADKLAEQFDAVEVAPDVHANGRYTLGENIADQGGLRVALTAYKLQRPISIDALQEFFIAYATVWAGNIREEEIKIRTLSDPHSLGKIRTNETLKNIAEFHEAFSVKAGNKMWRAPEERVIVW